MKPLALTVFALAAVAASSANAQSARPQNPGPVIPGVCVFNVERAIAQSSAGQAVQARLAELRTEVENEVAPYFQSVQSGLTSLQQNAASMPAEQRQQQGQQLEARYEEAQALAQTREQELRYTLGVQIDTIGQSVDPIVVAVYQERGCGLLLNASSVLEMNSAMDITDVVIQRANVALPGDRLRNFNRMQVPVQQQQPQR